MNLRLPIRLAQLLAVAVAACAATGDIRAARSAPATQPAWGDAKAGLQVSLAVEGDVTVGGKFVVKVLLRNVGAAAVKTPPAKDLFGWVFLVQQGMEEKKAYFSEKVFLASDAADWPGELAEGKVVEFKAADIGSLKATPFEKGLKIVDGYPSAPASAIATAPAGTVNKVLAAGKVQARLMLYLPRQGESPLLLVSNTLDVMVDRADMKGSVAELLRKFDKDAFAAQAAHGAAVKMGKDVLGDLIRAVAERTRPDFSRMWIATAIADIPDDKAAAALAGLLEDPLTGVRLVVAYHGPKQRSDKLDKAILDAAKGAKEHGLTAMAMLGFMVHRNTVPEELVKAGLESDDPKARATAAKVLSGLASDHNVARLKEMLKDKDQRVRAVAQKILDAMNQGGGKRE
jgi:hypothetical protein